MMHQSLRSQTQVSEIPSQACDSRHHDEDISLLHDSHNQPRIQQASWNSAEDECFQDIFDGLPNLHQLDNICSDNQLSPSTLDMRESPRRKTKSTNQDDEVVISESIRKKRTRSAEQNEVHNMSERKRRNKIKEKMNALQELIPNCNKSDKASMLDEAIEYMKVMKLQVHMISMAREAMWRTGCPGITNTPQMIPESSTPSMQMEFGMGMGFGIGMGMVNMCCYSEGKCRPFPQFQSTTTNPCSRLSSFSGPRSPVPFPQFQAAAPPSFMANSQVVPSDATASNSSSTVKPQLMMPKDFPYTFSPSTSQFSRDTNHNHEVPIQKPRQ